MYVRPDALTKAELGQVVGIVAKRRYQERMFQFHLEDCLVAVLQLRKMGQLHPTDEQLKPFVEAAAQVRLEKCAKRDWLQAEQMLSSNNGHGPLAEEAIRAKAEELYFERIKDEADKDWFWAEAQIRTSRKIYISYCPQEFKTPFRQSTGRRRFFDKLFYCTAGNCKVYDPETKPWAESTICTEILQVLPALQRDGGELPGKLALNQDLSAERLVGMSPPHCAPVASNNLILLLALRLLAVTQMTQGL